MKKDNGITLVSLVIYVIVMIIMVSIMSIITTQFYSNTNRMQGNVGEVLEFNKFNNAFLKEVKATNNKVVKVDNNEKYILFESGNSFSLYNNKIYCNDIEVCSGVKSMEITLAEEDVVSVTLSFGSFNKSMKYKLENIY